MEKETFTNWYPLYTRHTKQLGNARASYHTFFFGVFSLATYQDEQEPGAWAYTLEPLRYIEAMFSGEKYIDSLDDLMKEIEEDRSNIKKVKFRW